MIYQTCKEKRVIIFAHYDIDNIVDEYVFYYLNELKKVSSKIVFVSVSDLLPKYIDILHKMDINTIIRENTGYDFFSYKIGIENVNLNSFDEVVICNDSVFGPFFSIEKLFNIMSAKDSDFWGITNSKDYHLHLQSYFIVFRKRVIRDQIFLNFWKNVQIIENKSKLIKEYEVGFSKILLENHFKMDVYADYNVPLKAMFKTYLKYSKHRDDRLIRRTFFMLPRVIFWKISRNYNSSIFFWDYFLKNKNIPFIKKSLFITDKYKHEDIKILNHMDFNQMHYPKKLIFDYIKRISRMNEL